MNNSRSEESSSNFRSYDQSVDEWEKLWKQTEPFQQKIHGWQTPWLDTSMRDGNPIFSAWSPERRRGLRVIQHDDPGTFVLWQNTFAKGTADAVLEVVINCALTEEHLRQAHEVMKKWLVASDERDPTLEVELIPHLTTKLETSLNRAA